MFKMFKRKKKEVSKTEGIEPEPAKEKEFAAAVIDATVCEKAALIDAMPDALLVLDLDGKIIFSNPALLKMMGLKSVNKVSGRGFNEFKEMFCEPEKDLPRLLEMFGRLVEKGLSAPTEVRLRRLDGKEIVVNASGSLLRDAEGNPKNVAAILRDINEPKRAERLLQALNEAARSMEQALTPEEIFAAVDEGLKKLGFSCMVLLADEDQEKLFPKYWSFDAAAMRVAEKLAGLKAEDFPILIEDVDVCREVVWERETVFVENEGEVIRQLLQASPALSKLANKLARPITKVLKVSKSVTAPFIVGDKVIGTLSVQSDDMSTGDIPAVTAFADQMAAAWHKARLMQDLESSLAELKRAEEERREAETVQERAAIIDAIPDALFVLDLNGVILSVNPAYTRIFGWKPKERIGKGLGELRESIKAEDIEKFLKLLGEVIETGHVEPVQTVIRAKDGREIPASVTYALIKDDEGNPKSIIASLRDITELKHAQDEVAAARDYADNIIKSMIDTLIVVDPGGKIKTINPATVELLGYKEEELIGKPVGTIFAKEEEDLLFKGTGLEKLLNEGSVRDYDMTYLTKARERIPVSFSGSVMKDRDGKLVGIVGIARDIREIKRLMQKEKELAAAAATAAASEKKRAEELDKAYKGLSEKTDNLERFHRVTVGRELDMIKLKEEINSLLAELGMPKKYEAPDKINVMR